jgi:N-carbamoylputrescine amidase
MTHKMKIAVAQTISENGKIDENLTRATVAAEHARRDGAELVLFPELMPTGFELSPAVWTAAEARNGQTARWLTSEARRLHCWLGTTYLEAEGADFYNTFVLVDEKGAEAGRVRKAFPAGAEAFVFKGSAGPHIIDTRLGRIGVGICAESYTSMLANEFACARPDLILLPHSFPQTARLRCPPGTHVGQWYARRFGVPVAMSNKVGSWSSGVVGGGIVSGFFPGMSAIVAADGTVCVLMGNEAGVAVVEVALDPTRKISRPADHAGRSISELVSALIPEQPRTGPAMDQVMRERAAFYASSGERARAALAISGANPG